MHVCWYIIQAHCHAYVVKLFTSVGNQSDLEPRTAKVLQTLCKLYAVYGINQRLGEFMQVCRLCYYIYIEYVIFIDNSMCMHCSVSFPYSPLGRSVSHIFYGTKRGECRRQCIGQPPVRPCFAWELMKKHGQ